MNRTVSMLLFLALCLPAGLVSFPVLSQTPDPQPSLGETTSFLSDKLKVSGVVRTFSKTVSVFSRVDFDGCVVTGNIMTDDNDVFFKANLRDLNLSGITYTLFGENIKDMERIEKIVLPFKSGTVTLSNDNGERIGFVSQVEPYIPNIPDRLKAAFRHAGRLCGAKQDPF